jgi:hypothetical protein
MAPSDGVACQTVGTPFRLFPLSLASADLLPAHYASRRQRREMRVRMRVLILEFRVTVSTNQWIRSIGMVVSEDDGRRIMPGRLANHFLDMHRGGVGGTAKELLE